MKVTNRVKTTGKNAVLNFVFQTSFKGNSTGKKTFKAIKFKFSVYFTTTDKL